MLLFVERGAIPGSDYQHDKQLVTQQLSFLLIVATTRECYLLMLPHKTSVDHYIILYHLSQM
jgi:hypothetical protein